MRENGKKEIKVLFQALGIRVKKKWRGTAKTEVVRNTNNSKLTKTIKKEGDERTFFKSILLKKRKMNRHISFALTSESQNSWGWQGPPLIQVNSSCRVSYSRVPRTVSILVSRIFHGWRLHNLSMQPVPLLNHPCKLKKDVFLCSDRISCISACAHCLLSHHRVTPRRVWLCFLCAPPIRYL